MADYETVIRRLNELGYHQVKHLYSTGGLPPAWNLVITQWLAEQELETERLSSVAREREASAAERAASAAERASAAAERQAEAAERANRTAKIALTIAIISIITTIIGIAVIHFDTMRQLHPG
jgi:cytoskeletal protein RodZ